MNRTSQSLKQSQMFKLMREYEQGGLTQKAFCAKHQLSLPKMGYWRTQYLRSKMRPEQGFARVELVPSTDSAAFTGLEVEYTDGTKVRFGAETDISTVRSLLPAFVK